MTQSTPSPAAETGDVRAFSDDTLADIWAKHCSVNISPVNAQSTINREVVAAMREAITLSTRASSAVRDGWVMVPREPTEAMWSQLARQIVFWNRGGDRKGSTLYRELALIGMEAPEWLKQEIPDIDHVPPKGSVAVAIYKAMLAASPTTPAHGETREEFNARVTDAWIKSDCSSSVEAREAFFAGFKAASSTPPSLPAQESVTVSDADGCHGLDTPERVCFYEQDFYVLSNFSSFSVQFENVLHNTSEAAYHYARFATGFEFGEAAGQDAWEIARLIQSAKSAHDAFKIAQEYKYLQRPDWDQVKIGYMRRIITAKAQQHEYVHRKLLATGARELVENSWRDDFWGWGPNRDGKNMLGKLWMEVRSELREAALRARKEGV